MINAFLFTIYAFIKPVIDSAIINKNKRKTNQRQIYEHFYTFDQEYYVRREEAHKKMKLWNQWDLEEKYRREWNKKE